MNTETITTETERMDTQELELHALLTEMGTKDVGKVVNDIKAIAAKLGFSSLMDCLNRLIENELKRLQPQPME